MAKILITGGSGLLGKVISRQLLEMGHEPVCLSRSEGEQQGVKRFRWDPATGYIDPAAFHNISYVIHLAGAGILDHVWTRKYKNEIITSRVNTCSLLFSHLKQQGVSIKKIVGASAIGYYGSIESEQIYSESDDAGTDFLAGVCKKWEASYSLFAENDIPVAIARMGVILSTEGGAYPKMAMAVKLGCGVVPGTGNQYLSWIHEEDAAGIVINLLFSNSGIGTFNAVSSPSATYHSFMAQLAKSLHRKILLPPLPEWILRLILGERAVTLTRGLKIDNSKIRTGGYKFKFASLGECLEKLAKSRASDSQQPT